MQMGQESCVYFNFNLIFNLPGLNLCLQPSKQNDKDISFNIDTGRGNDESTAVSGKYIGCYCDTENRALPAESFIDMSVMDKHMCLSFCHQFGM